MLSPGGKRRGGAGKGVISCPCPVVEGGRIGRYFSRGIPALAWGLDATFKKGAQEEENGRPLADKTVDPKWAPLWPPRAGGIGHLPGVPGNRNSQPKTS